MEIRAKVAEAVQDDVGKGIVRIDTKKMKEIGVRPGEVVLIKSDKKETVAIADRAYPSDIGMNIVRMDGLTRWNAKTTIGEDVEISKAEVKPAKAIEIAPAKKGLFVNVPPDMIRKNVLGRALMKGDVFSLGGTSKRRATLSGNPFFTDIFKMIEDDFLPAFGGFAEVRFMIVSSNPKGAVIVTEDTKLAIRSEAVELKEDKLPDVTYEDIGGLDEPIRKVREMVETPMKHPEIFQRLGIEPPKGVLLYGPPGTGKTLLAKAVANETESSFVLLNGPEVMSKWVGEAEKKLREVFADAEKNAPSVIFIDEIDAIASKREDAVGEVERRVVAQLLALMDGMQGRGRVVVIAATNRPNAIDPALRRPGRFDREIEIGVPDKKGRTDILKIHLRNMPFEKKEKKDEVIKVLSEVTHGFVGADLAALAREAAMNVIREKVLPEISKIKLEDNEQIPKKILDSIVITLEDFKEGLKNVNPSAMREVLVEIPKVRWEDVGGLEGVKQELKEAVEWPLKHPESFQRLGIEPPKGILLYGPPGTGKTLLAKAVATESEANFISVKGPEIFSKWVGESEKAVRKIFKKARQVSPAVVMFDEIDAIAPKRGTGMDNKVNEKVVNQILSEMDGLEALSEVLVIATTNRPDIIDSSLLRPGRFDKTILVSFPDKEARKAIFLVHTKNMPIDKKVSIVELAEKTEGYSGADISGICREAAMYALREDKSAKKVMPSHFKRALKEIKPSISKKDVKFYSEFSQRTKSPEKMIEPSYLG